MTTALRRRSAVLASTVAVMAATSVIASGASASAASLRAGATRTLLPAAAATPSVDGSSVVDGNLRVQVLSPTLLRLEYAAAGGFEDRPTLNAVARGITPPPFTAKVVNGELVVRTSRVVFEYKEGSGPISATNTSLEYDEGGHHAVARPEFGSPARTDSLGGWQRGLDFYPGQAGPIDQVTLHEGMLNRSGWYLLDDTKTAVRTADGWVGARPARTGTYQDGYLFGYGENYKQGLYDLKTLTGPSPMLPKSAFGSWFSKYQAYTADDYKSTLLPAFRANNVPLDNLVVDTDWKAPNSWAGWNWSSALFPDPQGFLDWAAAEKLKVTLNVHAAVSADDPKYAAAQAIAGGALAPTTNSFAPNAHIFDWTDPAQAKAFESLHQSFNDQGIEQWWLDYCCDASTVSTPGVTADTWVNEIYRLMGEKRGLRGFSLARIGASFPDYNTVGESGPWAEHRSTIHFTGDTVPDWATLAFAAMMTPAEASIGQSYVSHDIGSFAGRHLPEDLYLRWMQLGAFQPIMRMHSDHGDRLPWEYSSTVSKAAADFMRLRESLVPYLYDTARQSYDSGLPMTRALYLDWPTFDEAYAHSTEYMMGDSLLVAPVTTPGLSTTAKVWFPPGRWTDFFTGASFNGPALRTVGASPDHMPVYIKAGGIIPSVAAAPNVASQSRDALTLTVSPAASGSTSLYDDAGQGLGYRDGEFSRTPVTFTKGWVNTLTIGRTTGTFPGQPAARSYTVVFKDVVRTSRVIVNGRLASSSYDAAHHTLTVKVPPTARNSRAVIRFIGRNLTVAPGAAVDFSFTAPNGLQSGLASAVEATARNDGPGTITNATVTLDLPAGWVATPLTATTIGSLAGGGTFTAKFTVTPAGDAPRFQNAVANLSYRDSDGTDVTLPAELQVPIRPVAVTFRVKAPPGTPADATLYIPGNIVEMGPWDPGKLAMVDKGNGIWEATITVMDLTEIQYKYTRGNWETVEDWGPITGTNNRSVTIDGGITGTMLVDDTSLDRAVPDIHKAPLYWRDPLVVSTTPASASTGAAPSTVTAGFNREIRPTGADCSQCIVVTRDGSAIAGTVTQDSSTSLVWTPAAPLPAGTYDVTVSQVNSDYAGSVPMQQPYTFSFTVE